MCAYVTTWSQLGDERLTEGVVYLECVDELRFFSDMICAGGGAEGSSVTKLGVA